MTITPSTDMLMQFGTYPATGAALSRGIVAGFGIDTICSAGPTCSRKCGWRWRPNGPGPTPPPSQRQDGPDGGPAPAGHAPAGHHRRRPGLAPGGRDRDATPGKQADIAIIDLRSPHLDGFGDPVATMVLGACPADVETVIVGGDIVKRDGEARRRLVGHARELMHAAREHLR